MGEQEYDCNTLAASEKHIGKSATQPLRVISGS